MTHCKGLTRDESKGYSFLYFYYFFMRVLC